MIFEICFVVLVDVEQIFVFIIELVDYECVCYEVVIDVEGICCSLFVEGLLICVLMCLSEGWLIGYVVYFYSYLIWLGCNGIYFEDFYVILEYCGVGVGCWLFCELVCEVVVNDCGCLEWSVLDWNQLVIDFYCFIGVLLQDEWVCYCLDGEVLCKMVEQLVVS